ncbi:hypothetical protein BASA62_009489 [Batrachochytrium salamandrivorans]|nr:hypothetical protein BASA62_009489 [Batrachochytrium salamandrivorans]
MKDLLKDLLETILKDLLKDLLEPILKDLLETILKNHPKKIVDLAHPLHLPRFLNVFQLHEKLGRNHWKDIVSVIKFGLGDAEYSKVESSLKEAYEILTDRANGYLKVVNAALSNIEKDVSTAKQHMEVIQVSFMYLFEAYIDYFEKLGLQLAKVWRW